MTKKTLEQLQEEHSTLCAQTADLGLRVPQDLTIDFDSAEVGSTVVSNLEALIRKYRAGLDQSDGLADASEGEHSADDDVTPRPSRARANKKARSSTKVADDAQPAGESTVANTAKKAKVAKNKTAKKVAKKAGKKAGRNTARVARPRGDGKSAKVVEMMRKNGGVTREQVLRATGWKAVSMQALAKAAGVKLKVNEKERPFRYSV
jgi:hypothetical protein